jgi:uncharacterized protein with NAD-binding domain and iron-sulfur cluster
MTSDPVSAVPPITKIKIAILGGGPGGISAAFWLTATPELRAKYDVAVYTPGWRLGGKCATGRNMSIGARIEEHGLHILMGCYTNAFRTIRSCFEEWKPRPGGPFQTWSQAFTPQRQITLQERVSGETSADWTSWNFVLPRLPGEPGDPDAAGAAVSAPRASMAPITGLETLVAALASWLADHLQNSIPPEVLVAIDYQATLRRFRTMVLQEDRDRDTVDDVHQSLEHIATRIRVNIAMTPLTSAVSRPHSNASEPPRTQRWLG